MSTNIHKVCVCVGGRPGTRDYTLVYWNENGSSFLNLMLIIIKCSLTDTQYTTYDKKTVYIIIAVPHELKYSNSQLLTLQPPLFDVAVYLPRVAGITEVGQPQRRESVSGQTLIVPCSTHTAFVHNYSTWHWCST